MADTARDFPQSKSQCLCELRDNSKLRRYYNSRDEEIGTFCTHCGTENLTQEYMIHGDEQVDKGNPNENVTMLTRPVTNLSDNRAFQIKSSRTKISLKCFADTLKPGDQISWHRPYCLWHHAIVESLSAETNELKLIHWNSKDGDITISRDCFNVNPEKNGLFNKMYRIEYPEEVTILNDPELVLARARSRLGDTGYSPFTDNCESFATYCKSVVEKSYQVAWLKKKLEEIAGQSLVMFANSTINGTCRILQSTVSVAKSSVPAGKLGHFLMGSNLVTVGIVLMIEGGYMIWDLTKAYAERKKGHTSRNDFIEIAVQRVVEGMMAAGVAILFSIGPALIVGGSLFCPAIIIGGIAGGILGGVVGKIAGTALGSVIGKAISFSFKIDDRAVTCISDLKCGDHIVLYRGLLHPRCHAIVVEHDGIDRIKVIRNKYTAGVVEEWIPFSEPLFRVEYGQEKCKDPLSVLKTARSKLGETRYCLALYNCKTFARQCKSNLAVDMEEEPWQLIQYDDIPEEALQLPCDVESVSTKLDYFL
ncbi:uncharacterized protein LOC117331585 [Pecten maximus]|uniref:uncharacterized protein LOC117331585 n=1 Tax=Pecten maximus TaxID=6579 RepID=UPI001458ACD0|nr:uncharacterized protein LOC117331585 [Pecten maximus]